MATEERPADNIGTAGGHSYYIPTPEQIAEECRKIRGGWSEKTRRKRKRGYEIRKEFLEAAVSDTLWWSRFLKGLEEMEEEHGEDQCNETDE